MLIIDPAFDDGCDGRISLPVGLLGSSLPPCVAGKFFSFDTGFLGGRVLDDLGGIGFREVGILRPENKFVLLLLFF